MRARRQVIEEVEVAFGLGTAAAKQKVMTVLALRRSERMLQTRALVCQPVSEGKEKEQDFAGREDLASHLAIYEERSQTPIHSGRYPLYEGVALGIAPDGETRSTKERKELVQDEVSRKSLQGVGCGMAEGLHWQMEEPSLQHC